MFENWGLRGYEVVVKNKTNYVMQTGKRPTQGRGGRRGGSCKTSIDWNLATKEEEREYKIHSNFR